MWTMALINDCVLLQVQNPWSNLNVQPIKGEVGHTGKVTLHLFYSLFCRSSLRMKFVQEDRSNCMEIPSVIQHEICVFLVLL